MDTKFKRGDGRPMNLEKHARVVKYKGGTLKNALDNFVNVAPYGKKLLAAQSEEEFNHLLRAEVPMFYDESEITRWNPVGNPFKTATNAKFGSAMRVDANNHLQTLDPVVIGGQPFTIQFWAYVNKSPADYQYYTIFSFGNILLQAYVNNGVNKPQSLCLKNGTAASGAAVETTAVKHYEIGYSNGNLMLFVDGTKKTTASWTIGRAARTVTLGGALGAWFSEFRILDGVCAHAANFTPPSAQYPVTSDTISLLHFD